MAKNSTLVSLLLFLTFSSISTHVSSENPNTFLLSSGPVKQPLHEKQSHLRLFFHDIISGPHPTAVRVAQASMTPKSSTFFGAVVMIDDPLTTGPESNSKIIGRAQGFYASAGLDKVGLLMAMNFVFLEGKYNGSSISILGRNEVFSEVREMPVVGGSGLFRMARGYVQARTHTFNLKTGDAVVEYNIFVNHY
ncbi:hypothetical protein LUZ60_007750 [Juncus effusus]|nr:hypothetical protein LUZ60_007750 [Juncus effusus]